MNRRLVVYGRQPVLEALANDAVEIDEVLVSVNARGDHVTAIIEQAAARQVRLRRVSADKVTRRSGNGRHDQGVVAEVVAPGLMELDDWLAAGPAQPSGRLFLLDGITNPANVGMILRTAAAGGLAATVLPRAGSPAVGPLVIKSSAGVAFTATVLSTPTATTAAAALVDAGWELVGMAGDAATPLWNASLDRPTAFVLGNETEGISASVAELVARWVAVPLASAVDSLNVAATAAVVAYEVLRRRAT